MKTFLTALLGLLVWLPGTFAQMLVEVKLEQGQFLPGEALPVAVRVTNRSGQTVQLGDEPDWLTFSVESRDSFVVSKNGEVPVLETFTLETAKVATKRVDLAPYFALTRPGRYRIVATVRLKSWGAQIASPPKDFDIVEGAPLWTREFGVPASPGLNQPPELRRYALVQANNLHSELRLYFRLSDAAGSRLFKVFPLGQMVSFGRPEAEVDGRSCLHVLHQNGARTSLYTVINPAGDVVTRKLYDYLEARPKLQLDREGNISVAGGVRRSTRDDLPAEKAGEAEPKPAKP
jgi:hypothetical protein